MEKESEKGAFITSPGVKRECLLAKENTASFSARFIQEITINILTVWLLQADTLRLQTKLSRWK